MSLLILIPVVLILILISISTTLVKEGNVAVITTFGKYKRMLKPGLHFISPLSESIFKKISIQNHSIELEFAAITQDQANVNFKTMFLYSVIDHNEETIKKVAFKFVSEQNFMQALVRSIEGNIRAFVATKKQNEVLGLRHEIVEAVKVHLDNALESWGYNLIDLQVNDITFDEAIMRSMAQVVASENLKVAAYNEGEAMYITKTKEAEADKESMRLKGEGLALLEDTLAEGIATASQKLKAQNLDYSLLMFNNWTETMKHIAEHGKGNVMFFDGSTDGIEKTIKQMNSLQMVNK
jgi:regulator of protease activity HflC (stomatin/prohibitin superfamily)